MCSKRPDPQLVAEAGDLAPGTAVDVGCGEGADAVWLADERVRGADASSAARHALGRVKELRGAAAVREQPDWLRQLARITATGEVWQMRDEYGARITVIAGFSYPNGVDRSVFLFDIDACGSVQIAHAGVFDDVPHAAGAWRAMVDNWFRARRRIHDLADALRKRGTPLPTARSLYHDLRMGALAR